MPHPEGGIFATMFSKPEVASLFSPGYELVLEIFIYRANEAGCFDNCCLSPSPKLCDKVYDSNIAWKPYTNVIFEICVFHIYLKEDQTDRNTSKVLRRVQSRFGNFYPKRKRSRLLFNLSSLITVASCPSLKLWDKIYDSHIERKHFINVISNILLRS